MFLNELLKASYLKEEAPTDDEITVLPAGAKPGIDCNLVVTRQEFERVLVAYRSAEPASEGILMAIGTAYDVNDPVWESLLKNETVVSHYTNLSSILYAKKLSDMEGKEDAGVDGGEDSIPGAGVEFDETPLEENIEKSVEEAAPEAETAIIAESADTASEDSDSPEAPEPDYNEEPGEEFVMGVGVYIETEEVENSADAKPVSEEQQSTEAVVIAKDATANLLLGEESFKDAEAMQEAAPFAPSMADLLAGTGKVPVVEEEEITVEDSGNSDARVESSAKVVVEEVAEGVVTPAKDGSEEMKEEYQSSIEVAGSSEQEQEPVPEEISAEPDPELIEKARQNVEHVLNDFVEIFTTYGADNVCVQVGTTFKDLLAELAENSDTVDKTILNGRDAEEVTPTVETIQGIASRLQEECFEVLGVGDMEWCNILLKPILRIIYEE